MAAGATGEERRIAESIRSAMEAAGLKREQLANAAGISPETLRRKLELVPGTLRLDELVRIADALEVSFETLYIGERVLA